MLDIRGYKPFCECLYHSQCVASGGSGKQSNPVWGLALITLAKGWRFLVRSWAVLLKVVMTQLHLLPLQTLTCEWCLKECWAWRSSVRKIPPLHTSLTSVTHAKSDDEQASNSKMFSVSSFCWFCLATRPKFWKLCDSKNSVCCLSSSPTSVLWALQEGDCGVFHP